MCDESVEKENAVALNGAARGAKTRFARRVSAMLIWDHPIWTDSKYYEMFPGYLSYSRLKAIFYRDQKSVLDDRHSVMSNANILV